MLQNINYNNLNHFLNMHKIDQNDKNIVCTHTSMGKYASSYYIKDEDLDIFHKLYNKALLKSDYPLHLIERHSKYGPIVIDIDFKFDNIEERVYTIDTIKSIINLYINYIGECFIIDDEEKLTSFVFERSEPYKSKQITKDGIHIMFPYIISEPNIQFLIREKILKTLDPILSNLPVKNSASDIIDRAVIESNGWFLYGSHKPNIKKYELTYIFDGELNEISIEDYANIDESFENKSKFFSIRNHMEIDSLIVRDDVKSDLKRIDNKNFKKKSKFIHYYDINQVKEFVEILGDCRANNYEKWIQLGICLHQIDPNNEQLLEIWDNFSKKSNKYKSGECDKYWNKFSYKGSDGFTIATLFYWAKNDNYDQFLEIKRKELKSYILKSTNKTPYDVAIVLYEMFKDSFVCASVKSRIWYEFTEHKWYPVDDAISLRAKISKDLFGEYCKVSDSIRDYATRDDIEDSERESAKKEMNALTSVALMLKKTSFKENVMKESMELFYKKGFLNKMDANPYLIGFNNGVYDLSKHEFRDGRPNDYVSMTTNTDYIDIDEDDTYIEDINLFMTQLLPTDSIREYVLLRLATYLEGYNKDQKFNIWTGVGGNGKSKLEELFIAGFGEYCIKFNISLLTQKRAASNACTPEIAMSKGKRFAYFEEPNPNEKINIGLMKEFTGGDKIKARTLYKEPEEFIPQFKLLLLCNHLPSVPPDDEGTWRRLEVVEFKSRFVKNPSGPNEYPRDTNLSEKISLWKETFMGLLLNYYKKYKKNGLNVPEDVNKFTQAYQRNCDIYIEFLDETIEEGNEDDIISIGDLHDDFKFWYTDNYNSTKYPTKRDFKKYLEKRFKEKVKNLKELIGFKYKETEVN